MESGLLGGSSFTMSRSTYLESVLLSIYLWVVM
jgi:hypothetical protein